jgi:pilus assembly protein CpaE
LRRPLSAVDLGQIVERLSKQNAAVPSRLGKVVSFVSNKGGVGKSTMAVNAAVGLAQRYPGRVLLVDAALQIGNCAAMLDVQPGMSLVDAAREHTRLDAVLLEQLAIPHPSGLHLLAAPANAIEGAEVGEDTLSRVLSLARRTYDYVLVDTFPLFDRNVMAVLDQTDEAYVVLENVVPTLLGIEQFLKLLTSIGFPIEKQRMVLNRYSRRQGNLVPSDAAQRLDRPMDLVVPYDRALIVAANLGQPFILGRHPFSTTARRLGELVRLVELDRGPHNGQAANGTQEPVETANLVESKPGDES